MEEQAWRVMQGILLLGLEVVYIIFTHIPLARIQPYGPNLTAREPGTFILPVFLGEKLNGFMLHL